jgi:hypothetical protein
VQSGLGCINAVRLIEEEAKVEIEVIMNMELAIRALPTAVEVSCKRYSDEKSGRC